MAVCAKFVNVHHCIGYICVTTLKLQTLNFAQTAILYYPEIKDAVRPYNYLSDDIFSVAVTPALTKILPIRQYTINSIDKIIIIIFLECLYKRFLIHFLKRLIISNMFLLCQTL